MRLAAGTAKTATLAAWFQTTSQSPSPAKESEPMRWTQPTPRRFGRRVKKWSESPSNRRHVKTTKTHENEFTDGENTMTIQTKLAGTFTFPNASSSVYRMGYGAMQLSGPEIYGPPKDVDAAIAVLREAIASGVNHID